MTTKNHRGSVETGVRKRSAPLRVFGDQVDARCKLDLDRTDAPGRKVRPKTVEDIKQVEVKE